MSALDPERPSVVRAELRSTCAINSNRSAAKGAEYQICHGSSGNWDGHLIGHDGEKLTLCARVVEVDRKALLSLQVALVPLHAPFEVGEKDSHPGMADAPEVVGIAVVALHPWTGKIEMSAGPDHPADRASASEWVGDMLEKSRAEYDVESIVQLGVSLEKTGVAEIGDDVDVLSGKKIDADERRKAQFCQAISKELGLPFFLVIQKGTDVANRPGEIEFTDDAE